MLGKQYSLGSTFAATGESLVKVANFEELKTENQDVATFLKGFTPDSSYVYLHVIAMGAGEYYGPNINGDYFPEADLINRHKTFETQAKVFREHDNKATSPSYGKVAFAWYNPKMHRVELILAIDKISGKEFIDRQARGEQLEVSMGCFPAGTEILLSDYTLKNIEDIVPNEKVISHLGNECKVVTKIAYPYSGEMVDLTISGQSTHLKATGNHPVLVRRYLDNTIYKDEWIKSKDIVTGDYVLSPKKETLNATNKEVFIDGNYIIKKVKDIKKYQVQDLPVYNMSVENDESYVANLVAVHNCKVAYDVCSICGNKAKRADDYCEHIRLHKNHIYPDGKQACMINYNPTFFDISIVRHRADRIAYVLDKVASADTSIQNTLAEEFENLGNTLCEAPEPRVWDIPEDDEFLGKVASVQSTNQIPKEILNLEKEAMIKRISSDAVKVVNKGIDNLLPALEKIEKPLPTSILDDIATHYDINDILKSFLSLAIQLKPKEFTRIIVVKNKVPLEFFGDVESGVNRALRNIQSGSSIKGRVMPSLAEKISPFVENRSSVFPLLLNRINKILDNSNDIAIVKQAAMYVPNPVGAYLDVTPGMNFGYVRHIPEFQDLNSGIVDDPNVTFIKTDPLATTPIPVTTKANQEILRPSINIVDKNSAESLGYMLGNNYAMYRNPQAIMAAVQEPDIMTSIGVLASLVSPLKKTLMGVDKIVKRASVSDLDTEQVLPFSKEHYFVANLPEDRYNNIHEELNNSKIKDEVDMTVKEGSLKNNIVDIAEAVFLPTYYFKKAKSPINVLASFGVDTYSLSKGLNLLL